MCVSAFNAQFFETKICMFEPDPAVMGKPIQVMLYQNTTVNFHSGPNAMLLHIDAAVPMGPENFIETTNHKHLLNDMVASLMPSPSRSKSVSPAFFYSLQVFDVGIYTVVLAPNAAMIPDALHRVPVDRRPALNLPLFEYYGQAFPGYTVALCCFNSNDESEPMMFWWEPRNPEIFRAPALDEHTGAIPEYGELVEVDHWLLASSYKMSGGNRVRYRDEQEIPQAMRKLLPNKVIGKHYKGYMPNGDFGLERNDILAGNMPSRPQRLMPPGLK